MNQSKFCLTPAEIERRLKESGIQATAQRIAISRYVLCEGNHPSADQVKEWADKNCPKVSLATVYNTLKLLVDAGMLKEFRHTHSDKVLYDPNIEHHHHFLDLKSGKLFDLEPKDINVKHQLPKGCSAAEIEVLIVGKK